MCVADGALSSALPHNPRCPFNLQLLPPYSRQQEGVVSPVPHITYVLHGDLTEISCKTFWLTQLKMGTLLPQKNGTIDVILGSVPGIFSHNYSALQIRQPPHPSYHLICESKGQFNLRMTMLRS